jgi:GT2 family glycosyltransferase
MTIGIVAIGRNEGARLEACLTSARASASHVVYVDSGSTDDSVELATRLGVDVVELDPVLPFTAGRARNEGVKHLVSRVPDLDLVQFVDGDCELHPSFVARAASVMRGDPKIAVVCGRRRERYPEVSFYNHLLDIEWATPVGDVPSCGGDALVRLSAFLEVRGFDHRIIAAEDDDLCFRLRQRGWKIRRIDAEMTLHDGGITRLWQWWQRSLRSGHASAERWHRHGTWRNRAGLREVVSNVAWALPVTWVLWPLLWWRVFKRRPDPTYATFIVLGKLPHCQGQLKFWMERLAGAPAEIIEYK